MASIGSSPERQSLRELLGLAQTHENSSPNTDFGFPGLRRELDGMPSGQLETADSSILDPTLSKLLSVSRYDILADFYCTATPVHKALPDSCRHVSSRSALRRWHLRVAFSTSDHSEMSF